MNTKEVAEKLVNYCRQGKNDTAIEELYADSVISLEPEGSRMERTEGKQAVISKSQQWHEMVEEIHDSRVSDPIINGDFFSVGMFVDVTYKNMGRQPMDEIAVFEVQNGKIVQEQFFYSVPQ